MKSPFLTHLLACLVTCLSQPISAQSSGRLWYKQPAQTFEESLVLGNGKQGASVLGGVSSDKIYLNDITLWNGGPVNPNMNPDAYKNLPAVREALRNENYKRADSLNRKIQGPYSSAYAPLGTLSITPKQHDNPQNYTRELAINEAIALVAYDVRDVHFTREYFVSYPDQVLAVRLTASKKGALSVDLAFESLLSHTVSATANGLIAKGNAAGSQGRKGTAFTTVVSIQHKDGSITRTDSTVGIANATEAVIYVSTATNFSRFDKDPNDGTVNDEAVASAIQQRISKKAYGLIRKAHVADYQTYFNRVSLQLGQTSAPDLPTDERLKRYSEGNDDKALEALYFQFGRYLLISCSRTEGVPANLQGLWNHQLNPPWNSNYTTNINTEENYWLAETTNLSEMHRPLLSFIGNLATTGRVTAKTFYGIDTGWAACHNSDIWAMTNPVGEGKGSPQSANWNMSGAWLSTHLWEHYLFSKDTDFLTNNAYPLMKGAAQFCLAWLVEDKKGYLITSPSVSPENKYLTTEGYKGHTMYGSTGDLAMIRECFTQTIKAADLLHVDAEFSARLRQALTRLYPYQIGKKGNLQEWYHDWEDAEFKHQHQTHLFGLYPGHQITPDKTPAEAAACRNTLEQRGDQTTGWSKAWRINLWARLYDGNRAYKMFRELLRYVEPMTKRGFNKGGTYPNLLDAHPPFQIDGNFGGTAAIAEMLMQSDENEIRLLPALPDAWDSGTVSGLCARGGFVVSMTWADKRVKSLTISAKQGGSTTLICNGKQTNIMLRKGEKTRVNL